MRATLFSQATSDKDGLKQIIDHCHYFCLYHGLSLRDMSHVLVICDEMAANIAHHGYGACPRPSQEQTKEHKEQCHPMMTLKMSMRGCFLRICFEDEAPPFNPLAYTPAKPASERGGFGLSLVKAFVHRMHYRRDGGCNIITMVKYLDFAPVNGGNGVVRP